MGTARETTDPSETEFARHRRLPAVAGSRTAPGRAQACCLSRFNRGTDSFWPEFSRYKRTRQSSVVASCAKSCGNRSSLVTLASARRRIPRTRVQKFRGRPARRGEGGGSEVKPPRSGAFQPPTNVNGGLAYSSERDRRPLQRALCPT